MQEKELKTSLSQRIIIGIIAVLLFASTIAIYALIVLNGEKNKATSSVKKEELAAVTKELTETASEKMSKQYFNTLNSFRSRVKAYNAETVQNAGGYKVHDLKSSDGAEITDATKSYYAYYIGWCPDESVFDSSFDDPKKPTALKEPLAVTNPASLIAGWSEGIKGMKIGAVREVDIPGALAYGNDREICGAKNSPLKFIILPISVTDEYKTLNSEYSKLYNKYQKIQAEINGLGA